MSTRVSCIDVGVYLSVLSGNISKNIQVRPITKFF